MGKWLGWLDSNQRMAESESAALPLGDTPIDSHILSDFHPKIKDYSKQKRETEISLF